MKLCQLMWKKEGLIGQHKLVKESILFRQDEGVRPDTNIETLSKLHPAFSVTGTVTAGNASQISDGAAAVMVMDRKKQSL